jgi:hypothetical protein
MARKVRLNRRLAALLTVLALLATAPASRATWRCADGTPCPLDCPMAHPASSRAYQLRVSIPRCPHCLTTPISGGVSIGCASCHLSIADHPAEALRQRAVDSPDAVALPAFAAVGANEPVPVSFIDGYIAIDPSPPPRNLSGRSPPFAS